ncbi:family 78 glycoside hydrolase catalytic domain [Sedimentisphaera salicampi]|uniref:family 78 glycoside hydrolase catalytic domain n=1 Tax=Sedimentisphaera salicampi TaxID=1941349 RepID=UPI000B9A3642|nr:family 78 glycoside hydrolase catalytic domain [Sedimentisphaera salicampi]OXU15124.1 Bacterial alpha-L-rhamnosidase [Sedimentisphaera salicampi]
MTPILKLKNAILPNKKNPLLTKSKWIWLKNPQYCENQWVNIRRTFDLDSADPNSSLHISIDTDYCVWINGQFVYSGQFSDYPKHKHYDTLKIGDYLKNGINCLAILGYYQGKNTSRYIKGQPGIIFAVENYDNVISSDRNCRIRTSPEYQNGPIPHTTAQLGYNIICDASQNDGWTFEDYDDNNWEIPIEKTLATNGFWGKLDPRPLPKLSLSKISAGLIEYGSLNRSSENIDCPVAQTMAQDTLIPLHQTSDIGKYEDFVFHPKNEHEGCYAIFDLGQESFGYLELELTAERGTAVDIAHGEHLLDKRVRCCIEDRNFADRYICAEGRQNWMMPARRLGCRYLELHFTRTNKPVQIHRIGLKQVSYPVKPRGRFECSNELHNRIYELCTKTLELCMHEHYEDCPWREQALYSSDARIQALCGYYAFGEYDFPEVSLRLLGESLNSDGFLELCAPSVQSTTIPCFSLIWIVAIQEHILFSGRSNLGNEFAQQIDNMLKSYISMCNEQGLMESPQGSRYWNFYEWTPALNGCQKDGKAKIESPLNLFLLESFNAAAEIFKYIGDKARYEYYSLKAEKLKDTLSSMYGSSELLPTQLEPQPKQKIYSQLTESLALITGIPQKQSINDFCKNIVYKENIEKATLCNLLYVYKAVILKSDYKAFVLEDIAEKWGHMLKCGATSCWETIKGAYDFNGAGSLCHGWSTVPIYFYYSLILGVKPLEPGFKTFSVNPYLEEIEQASGEVPTPYGNIAVKWDSSNNVFYVSHPKAINPCISEEPGSLKILTEKY